MQSLQTGLRLTGVSEREGMGEAPIHVEVHAPGQRGALQLLIQSKRELQLIKPHMTRVIKSKQKISRDTKRRHDIRAKIVRKTHQLQSYCNKILARANEIDAKQQQLIEDNKRPQTSRKRPSTNAKSSQKNKKRGDEKDDEDVGKEDDDDDDDDDSPKASSGIAGESIDYLHVIDNILKSVNRITAHLTDEEAIIEESLESTELAQQCDQLAGELKRQIESSASLTRSIMGTQFNRDAKTATGRGPPGHIAFSPFTANDPLFERDDVMQVILETNRRNGKV